MSDMNHRTSFEELDQQRIDPIPVLDQNQQSDLTDATNVANATVKVQEDLVERAHPDFSHTLNDDVKSKKKRDGSSLRKAPQAPKRFKSSYILFFMAKQDEIKAELGPNVSVGEISKRSSQLWKALSTEERAHWDEVAAKDKQRYMEEKATYTGPWQVPWKRAKKDPSAPKRPMSAFLYFSQDRRRMLKDQNPGMRNTDISRILGDLWRKASDEERGPHIEREARERERYKAAIAQWRRDDAVRKEQIKKVQAEQAKQQQNMYPMIPVSAADPATQSYFQQATGQYGDQHFGYYHQQLGYGPTQGPAGGYVPGAYYPQSHHQAVYNYAYDDSRYTNASQGTHLSVADASMMNSSNRFSPVSVTTSQIPQTAPMYAYDPNSTQLYQYPPEPDPYSPPP